MSIIDQLALYGPEAPERNRPTLDEALAYCRNLARRHYENFTVAHWLLPGALRQHFVNVYAYCRWADDLADEISDPREGLALLDWWEGELRRCFSGEAEHPVFVALAETIGEFDLPIDPLADLLVAFRQDQQVSRYDTFDELLDYCRYSANPVGRIVLHLGRCSSPQRVELSDQICTGLQLANFWQDVSRDYRRGRIYLPAEDCRRYDYTEDDFAAAHYSPAFRRLMSCEVERTRHFLQSGGGLVPLMPRELQLQIELFVRGGLKTLEAIRRRRYDVWTRRPTLSKMTKLHIFIASWWHVRQARFE